MSVTLDGEDYEVVEHMTLQGRAYPVSSGRLLHVFRGKVLADEHRIGSFIRLSDGAGGFYTVVDSGDDELIARIARAASPTFADDSAIRESIARVVRLAERVDLAVREKFELLTDRILAKSATAEHRPTVYSSFVNFRTSALIPTADCRRSPYRLPRRAAHRKIA